MEIRKVLLVDDDPCIRRIAQFSLERVGRWEVVTAGNGREGTAAANSEQPDLILLDVRLPDIDGPSMLKTLRHDARTNHIPVVLMTARVQQCELEEYKKLDVSGVISKPFDPLTLPSQIQKLVSSTFASG